MQLRGLLFVILFGISAFATGAEPTKAAESIYEKEIWRAITSEGLTKADVAWHALNTFGWPCSEVVDKEAINLDGYYVITCKTGTKLRVYPRQDQHPRITNIKGEYE